MTQEEVARRLAGQLASMARDAEAADLPTLGYLIRCARLEARHAAGERDARLEDD